ncbi:acyl-CoA dehydrogenase family protein [Streptomyces orinoci]|uniref:Acyl-CoA dehydrogenase family protein n=1 Tax=Streptomyces orinoci TaxID=67339 RepID=A0ABV3JS82_STRON|nr:acyl-CoA dehydrogenase family protein [Streptomyces orinoci]
MSDAGFLAEDRRLLEDHLPGLDARLAQAGLDALERPGSPAIDWFRQAGAPGLFIPRDHGGLGVGLRDGIRIQRAIGCRAPSLAVATTMHHFSVAGLTVWDRQEAGMEWLLAEAVARNSLLVASGAAEGRPGSGILRPDMSGRPTDGGILVSGSKKPCSLSSSMDLLFATVRIDGPGDPRLAIAVIPADSPGLDRRSFWPSHLLAGAESDEVILRDVFVPRRLVSEVGPVGTTSEALRQSLVRFELLIAASYAGMAAALVERVLAAPLAAQAPLAAMAVTLEGACYALEGVAARADELTAGTDLLGPALLARYHTQDAVVQVAAAAVEALGGGGFLADPGAAYLQAAVRCLAFHPPARAAATGTLADHLRGQSATVE